MMLFFQIRIKLNIGSIQLGCAWHKEDFRVQSDGAGIRLANEKGYGAAAEAAQTPVAVKKAALARAAIHLKVRAAIHQRMNNTPCGMH